MCMVQRCLAAGKVTGVAWTPGTRGEFVASFSSGVLLFMHRDRDDQPAQPQASPKPDQHEDRYVTRLLLIFFHIYILYMYLITICFFCCPVFV